MNTNLRTYIPIAAAIIAGVLHSSKAFVTEAAHCAEPQTENTVVVQSLFEYPVAPDELVSINERSNWVIEHFWEPLDIKSSKVHDQSAFNHAFSVYADAMRWADRDIVMNSIDVMLKKLQKNPVLLLQMTKAAEENLYGPRAMMFIDEVYVKYLEALTKNKKVNELHRERYGRQLKSLSGSMAGAKAPLFKFEKPDGSTGTYFPMSTFTIIEFGDPECSDCRIAKLKMEVNARLSEAVGKGKVNILFIMPDAPDTWKENVASYPSTWTVGNAPDVDETYDIRLTPTFYTIDTDGRIKSKNITVEQAIDQALESIGK